MSKLTTKTLELVIDKEELHYEKLCRTEMEPNLGLPFFDATQAVPVDTNRALNDILLLVKQQHGILVRQQAMLNEQQILLKRIAREVFPQKQAIQLFPIKTMDDLINADTVAARILHEDLILYIKSILGKAELHRSLECLLSKDVIMNSNWDGARGFFKLSSLQLFNTYVFEAVRSESMGYRDYEEEMKKAFHITKQRTYKATFRNKQLSNSKIEN